MIYQCWHGDDTTTFSTKEGCEDMLKRGLMGDEPIFAYEFEADSWTAAMTEHHKRQGWESYVPFVEEDFKDY